MVVLHGLCPGNFHKEYPCLSILCTSLPSLSLPSHPGALPRSSPLIQGPISSDLGTLSPCLSFPGDVPISRAATALPLPGHRASWSSSCSGSPQERKHPPQVSQSPPGTLWHLMLAGASQQTHFGLSIEALSANTSKTSNTDCHSHHVPAEVQKETQGLSPRSLSNRDRFNLSILFTGLDTGSCYIFPGHSQVSPMLSSTSAVVGQQDVRVSLEDFDMPLHTFTTICCSLAASDRG